MLTRPEAIDIQIHINQINMEIEELDSIIAGIKIEMPLKGAIIYRYIKCGKPKCDCKRGTMYYHGPYPHLEWIEDGKVKTKYLNKQVLQTYEDELAKNKKVKELFKKRSEFEKERTTLEKIIKKYLRQNPAM